MRKKPVLANRLLIEGALTFYGNRYVKKKINLFSDGEFSRIQPPYIVLANHCSFADVAGLIKLMHPVCANFVASETQIVQWPKLIMQMGILPKKQFTVDMSLLSSIKYCLQNKRPVVIYPEAKLSVTGTPNMIKPSVAKLVKMFKVPLVTVCFHGSYLHRPRWAKSSRYVPVMAEIKVAADEEEVKTLSVQEIYRRIVQNLQYDDYAYQRRNQIKIFPPDLLDGIQNVLYKCPCCGAEFRMSAQWNKLSCKACGETVHMDEYGVLHGGKFCSVTTWYEWQKKQLRREIEEGKFCYDHAFAAQKLVKGKYRDAGGAHITQDGAGTHVLFESGERLEYPVGTFYTLSFNNDYVFLPTAEAVYRFKRVDSVGCTTKLNIAIEQYALIAEGH